MNETSDTAVEPSEEWRKLPAVLCLPPKFEGLEQRETFSQPGDYWVSFINTIETEHVPHADADAAKLHAVSRACDVLLGGWDAWYGRRVVGANMPRTFGLENKGIPYEFELILHTILTEFTRDARYENVSNLEDADALCSKLESRTGYKVHKHARALYLKHLQEDKAKNPRREYSFYHEAGPLRRLAKLHSLVVNRFAIPIGLGFEGGNPLVILAEPVCRDGHRVDSFRTKSMRLGKWLQSVWGNVVDIRPLVEDIKVLNRSSTTYLCTTEQEWYDAYENGPDSCMTRNDFAYSPVRCYASTSHGLPDNGLRLFIQYTGELFGNNFEVQARAIVNVNSNTYVRAYGPAADAALRAAGYRKDGNCLAGCVLARIPYLDNSACVLMPYLDGRHDYVDEHIIAGVKCFVVNGDGDYQALESSGYIYLDEEEARYCYCGVPHHGISYSTHDGFVGSCCIAEYHEPVRRADLYHEHLLYWSEWHDDWVHSDDATTCAIQGLLHEDCDMTEAQGYNVLDQYVERGADGGYILTLEACEILGEDYLGGPDEDEQEEAA